MDLKKRLAELDRLTRAPVSSVDPADLSRTRALTIDKLNLKETSTPAGPVWTRQYRDEVPGPGEKLPDLREFFAGDVGDSPGPGAILFLDTETTGLAGGTGTIPFLIGVSWWEPPEMITRQYFLPEPVHEAAMLEDLSRLADGFQVVVTFNGASFDLPLLRTRSRLNRLDDPVSGLASWDLLVPARRLYGNRLPDCRQQTLERMVCGIKRESGDIEGSCIPQTWFDFLATGRADLLPRVLAHNHRDMTGMGCLFGKVTEAARMLTRMSEPTCELNWLDTWALGRICERRRDTETALACLGAATVAAFQEGGGAPGNVRFMKDAVRIMKRGSDWPLVEKIIQVGLAAGIDQPWLHREAAILYEHRLIKLPKALDHARKCGEDHRVKRLQRMLGSVPTG